MEVAQGVPLKAALVAADGESDDLLADEVNGWVDRAVVDELDALHLYDYDAMAPMVEFAEVQHLGELHFVS